MSFVWDGKNNEGIRCNDGTYKASLAITTANGSDPSTVTGDFEIDTKYPSLIAEVPYSFFSPDSDRVKDSLPVSIKDATNEKKWTVEIRNAKDKVVKSFVWIGKSNSFVWGGSNESGNLADNGKYSVVNNTI